MKRTFLLSLVLLASCAVAGWRGAFDEAFAAASSAWTPARLNPVAWYKGEDNAQDSAGAFDGTWSGTAAYADGIAGRAFSFAGGNLVSAADNAALRPANLTVATWIYQDGGAQQADPSAVGKHSNYKIQVSSDGKLSTTLYPGGARTYIAKNITLPVGWTHVAMTYDGSAGVVYTNGALLASEAMSGAITTAGSALGIGYDSYSTDRYFRGMLDDVLIFNRALTAAEVKKLYDETVKRNGREWQ